MHAHAPTDRAECRLTIRPLPLDCRPALVVRHNGVTVMAVDPTATRLEMMGWTADNLTEAELTIYRTAYGEPPVGQPVSEKWMGDDPVETYIPPVLTLSYAPTAVPVPRGG